MLSLSLTLSIMHLQVDVISRDEAAYQRLGGMLGGSAMMGKSSSKGKGRTGVSSRSAEQFTESVVTTRSLPMVFHKRNKPAKNGPEGER